MLEFNFDPFPVLETQRLHLRKIVADDVNDMFAMRSDEAIMHYIPRPIAKTTQDAMDIINMMTEAIDKKTGINWGIALKENNMLIGMVGFVKLFPDHHRAELGYLLHGKFHKKGIMAEATAAVIQYGFETMNLHSMEAIINPENTNSKNVLERNGFRKEAHYRENFLHRGVFEDTFVYGLLKTEYKLL